MHTVTPAFEGPRMEDPYGEKMGKWPARRPTVI
jgi:hypothetical protein